MLKKSVATSRRNSTMKIKPKPQQKTNNSVDIMNFLVKSFRKVSIGIENGEPVENDEIVEKILTRLRSIDDSEYIQLANHSFSSLIYSFFLLSIQASRHIL